MSKASVLVVDDEAGIRESISDILSDEGYAVHTAVSGEEALSFLEGQRPDVVLLDVWLPGIDGLETLKMMKEKSPETPVIMVSGHGNIETAVRATRNGAYDFLEKPLSLERVVLAAERALERKSLELENRELRETLTRKCVIVGTSRAIETVQEQTQMAASSNGRVLISGESGTGKELVARRLHELSARARGPFVEVNCAAIPQELIESELFGHEKGSFTGAFERKKGKFELADGGSLFLDEVGDMSLQTQARLLRVLETQSFQRVGGSKNITVDVRVISATNKNLEEMIREDRFRGDLFFRLNVVPIELPPLRERRGDIPLLVEHFLGEFAAEYGQAPKTITREALKKLAEHDWPGNIRELRNLIERLVIMTPSDTIEGGAVTLEGPPAGENYLDVRTLREARDLFEKNYITKKLKENNWNISRTAEVIEIERSNLHRKIKSYRIRLPQN
jgi:two-component system nitrogen regulation response regulator NtrX